MTLCATYGYNDTLKQLLNNGDPRRCDIVPNDLTNPRGWSIPILQTATYCNQFDIIKRLMKISFDDIKTKALDCALYLEAPEKNKVIKLMLDNGVLPDYDSTSSEQYQLMLKICGIEKSGRKPQMREHLEKVIRESQEFKRNRTIQHPLISASCAVQIVKSTAY